MRAGSIIPDGPEVQSSSEKADPIELRVYRGADGSFTLYDDEGDNYNYEKGVYATIPFTWNDEQQTLTIGPRRGQYPGMLTTRTFRIFPSGFRRTTESGSITRPSQIKRLPMMERRSRCRPSSSFTFLEKLVQSALKIPLVLVLLCLGYAFSS